MMGYHPETLPPDIKLVLFDLHGTLRIREPSVHSAVLAFASELGYSFAPKAQKAGLRWAQAYWAGRGSNEDSGSDPVGGFFWSAYIRGYLAAMGLFEDALEGAAIVIGRRFEVDYAPTATLAPGARQILWQLREQQIKLGLISNQRRPLTGVAIEMGIIEYFDFTLSAGQIGRLKPDPLIFQQALALSGDVQAEEAVHVGDNYYTDVLGARRVGLHAVLLDEHDAFSDAAEGCWRVRRLAEIPSLLSPEILN